MSTYSLGIELGADEAIAELGHLRSVLTSTADAEDKVVAASKRVTAQNDAQAKSARALANEHRAQENARRQSENAQQEGARTFANAERERLLAYRASALEAGKSRAALLEETRMKRLAKEIADEHARILDKEALAEKRVQEAEDRRVRSMALLEIQAHKLNAAGVDGEGNLLRTAKGADAATEGFNKLRPGVVALATSITGANGPLNSLIGTFGQLTVGGAVTVGVVAGGAAIAAIIGHVTEKTREQRKETDEAIKSLREYANAQRQGDAGKFGEQVARSTEELKQQRAELLRLRESLDAQQNQRPVAGDEGGFSFFDASKLASTRKQIAELENLTRIGQENVTKIEQDASFERLTNLAKNNQLTTAQHAQARILIESNAREIARIQSEIAKTFNPDPKAVDQLLRLTAQNKALAESLDPVDKKTQKLGDQFAKTAATVQLELDKQRELTAAFGQGARAIEDINDKYARKAELANVDNNLSAAQQAWLRERIKLTYDEKEAVKTLTRAEEDRANVFKNIAGIRSLTNVTVSSETKATEIRLLNAAAESWKKYGQAIVDASKRSFDPPSPSGKLFDDEFVENAQSVLSIAEDISRTLNLGGEKFAAALSKAAGGFSQALQGASAVGSAASIGASATGVGAIVVGAYKIFDSYKDNVREQSEAARQAAIALRELRSAVKESVASYKLQAGTSDLDQTLFTLKKQFETLIADLKKAGGVDPFASGRKAVNVVPTAQDFSDVYAAYQRLVEKAIADAAKAAADAVAQAAKEAAEEARRVDRSVSDLQLGRRAFTDPRGSALATLEENQRRRLDDASTAAEKLEVALYNAAEKADFFAKRAESDRRTAENTIGTVLGFLGNSRKAEDFTRESRQRQQTVDAAGESPFNRRMIEFSHDVEDIFVDMQRAIEDGTKAINAQREADLAEAQTMRTAEDRRHADAMKQFDKLADAEKKNAAALIDGIKNRADASKASIDAQIDGFRAQQEFQQESISLLEESVRTQKQVVQSLNDFLDSSKLGPNSPLSPIDKQKEAERQFSELLAAALRGDAGAATRLGSAADSLFESTRNVYASSAPAADIFDRAQVDIGRVRDRFGGSIPAKETAIDAAKQGLVGLQKQIELLGEQKNAIDLASENEIKAIQEASDATLVGINDAIEKENARHEERLGVIDKEIDAINKKADTALDTLVKDEESKRDARVGELNFYDEFSQYRTDSAAFWKLVTDAQSTRGGVDLGGGDVLVPTPRAADPVQAAQLDALHALVSSQQEQAKVVQSQLTELRNTVAELRTLAGVASPNTQRVVDGLGEVVEAVSESANEMRRYVSRLGTRNS